MTQVRRLAVDLGRAGPDVVRPLAKVVDDTARAVRDDLRERATGHPRFRYLPAAITHDTRGLSAEIGPDKTRRGGAIGNILYFGTATSGPVLEHPAETLQRHRRRFEAAVADAAASSLTRGLRQ